MRWVMWTLRILLMNGWMAAMASSEPAAAHQAASLGRVAEGAVIVPEGIFFNRFTGLFGGTEWFQTFAIPGTDRYRLADIFGGGFNATITAEGLITLDSGAGGGGFTGPDRYTLMPFIGGSEFIFECRRVPLTDANFPLRLVSPHPGNALLAGQWDNQLTRLNAETGAVLNTAMEVLNLTVDGTSLRVVDPAGAFFQGVFENAVRVAFRRIVPEPDDSRFASFPGSDLNLNQNLLGLVEFQNVNRFDGFFLLQSRTPLGNQTQDYFHFSVTRSNPRPAGDVDGSGFVDMADRTLLIEQIGLNVEDAAFNLAADLDENRLIDAQDLAIFDSGALILRDGFELTVR